MTSILLVGCGKMGSALLKGWSRKPSYIISTCDPHYEDADYQSVADITASYDVIILAVKPQIMGEVTESIRPLVKPTTLVLTIAAGKPISFYESILGSQTPIVRVMPNTPALVGKGMSVLCGSSSVSDIQAQLSMILLSVVGDVEWIDEEELMDAVTALSGSGPAYVFHLIEAMTAAGIEAGLPADLSTKLARETVIGSAALAASESDTPASTLRQNVTSPGGTTEAALNVLMSERPHLTDLMTRAILAAKKRGQELAS